MNEATRKKNKFFAFLTSLCSSQSSRDRENSKDMKKSKLKINKVPRLTFQLDRVLVKVSRKNVAEEEFMEHDVLTYHLEKYLATRFKECDIAIFSGEFSNFLIQKIPFCLEMKSSSEEFYERENNYILTNQLDKLKFKHQSIDLMVFQLYFGENESSIDKCLSEEKDVEKDLKKEINENIDKIEETLKTHQKKIKNFAFICHKDLKLEDIHDLFLVFKETYFFEFEKVKKIEKPVCNIIYVSTETKFLKIDDSSLSDFVICEFDKMRAFGELKKNTQSTLGTDNSQCIKTKEKEAVKKDEKIGKEKSRNQIIMTNEGIKRQTFYNLINIMFQRNLHLKVSQSLATILEFPEKKPDKINWFLDLMYEKSPQSRDLIDSFRNYKEENEPMEVTKTYSDFTPMFEQRLKESNIFSKMTAIFETKSSPQDEFLLSESPKKQQDVEIDFSKHEI